MNRLRSFVRDDENDTGLFEKLEEYVLRHYPNPHRIGCLDRKILVSIVEAPEQLDLADPMYLHIFKCAECTRDLSDLRRIREDHRHREHMPSVAPSPSGQENMRRHPLSQAFAWMRSATLRLADRLTVRFGGYADRASAIPAKIDLSGSAVSESESPGSRASLPRALVDLYLVLPAGSQVGAYRVAIATGRNINHIFASDLASAIIHDSLVELRVTLDLRRLERGEHYLVIRGERDRAPHFYPLFLD